MGKCHSKESSQSSLEMLDLEKTLQLCLNERDEYKEKHETLSKEYKSVKTQLTTALKSIKTLQRQLAASEENVTSLYLRYAIESDLNRRIKKNQKTLLEENHKLKAFQREVILPEIQLIGRLEQFEERLHRLEQTSEYI